MIHAQYMNMKGNEHESIGNLQRICKVYKTEYSKSIDKRYAKDIKHVPKEIDMQ